MKRLLTMLLAMGILLGLTSTVYAVSLYVDSAPNVYGSSDWDPWWTQTKQDVVSGSFTNLRTGTFPGTTTIDPYDEIVYSTGDLGKRLHWIYWLPGENTSDLGTNDLFEVKWVIDWAGNEWTYEEGDWAENAPDVGWSEPSSWEDYDDGSQSGVIGSLGFAWWANDNHAEPYNSTGSLYDETNQADIDALRDQVFNYQTFATGMARIRQDTDSEWQTTSLQVNVVPEPTTWLLFGTGLLGLLGFGRKKLFKKA